MEPQVGRPTVMTPEVIAKLEEIFALGGTDLEACFYAGINKASLYRFQQENPEFSDRKEALKNQPVLAARRTVVASLRDPRNAQWYLERRDSEFNPKTQTDITSKGESINVIIAAPLAEKHGITSSQPINDCQ